MYIADEEIDDTTTPDPAAAAAEAPAADPQPTEEQVRDKALSAFDEGVEEAGGKPAPKPDPVDPGDDPGDDGDDPGEPETPEQIAERLAAEAKAADDAEVAELGLTGKGKTEARFREMSGKIREQAQQLESIGGNDTLEILTELGGREGLDRVIRDAQDQQQWDSKITEIGCTPEQFGQAMGYIAAINSDDEAVLRQARDNMLKEVAMLDGRLGDKTERFDPLDAHPDLKARVQSGGIDEEDALELARARGKGQKLEQITQTTTQEARMAQAQEAARGDLGQLGQQLIGRDGKETFDAKMELIREAIDTALPDLPPAKWASYAQKLYDGVKLPKPPERPRAGKQPVRQSHVTAGAPAVRPNVPTDKFGAFEQGVEDAREMGL